MPEDHDLIEELLAGYVLRSLSGEDADAADRMLVEHVPACPMCRDTLQGFQGIAGELALAPSPVTPPDMLLPRIHQELDERPASRRRTFSTWMVAAGVVAVLGLAAWNVMLGARSSSLDRTNGLIKEALGAAARPDASRVLLQNQGSTSGGPLTGVSVPGATRVYLVGDDVPPPAAGHVYWVWFGSGGQFQPVDTFEAQPGVTILRITIDPSKYDQILITEESAGSSPASPSSEWRWAASLTAG